MVEKGSYSKVKEKFWQVNTFDCTSSLIYSEHVCDNPSIVEICTTCGLQSSKQHTLHKGTTAEIRVIADIS